MSQTQTRCGICGEHFESLADLYKHKCERLKMNHFTRKLTLVFLLSVALFETSGCAMNDVNRTDANSSFQDEAAKSQAEHDQKMIRNRQQIDQMSEQFQKDNSPEAVKESLKNVK